MTLPNLPTFFSFTPLTARALNCFAPQFRQSPPSKALIISYLPPSFCIAVLLGSLLVQRPSGPRVPLPLLGSSDLLPCSVSGHKAKRGKGNTRSCLVRVTKKTRIGLETVA